MRNTRPISWLKGALRAYRDFPTAAQEVAEDALTQIAEGGTPDVAKPLTGLGSGVWELTIRARGDAYRVVYALQLADAIWIIHAFQKKSKSGIATPRHEIDVVRERLKRLKEQLR
jgi:phage-related protein